ncbi:hypothetical protein CFOL_v3_18214 [Cephalotus follicularis]|uniref:PRLI-interacting factor A n=1 Tax=Cephalotus follicularis TaxID=3775 RepID=A0A1Q3C3C2_CEPFO|nr:hypothetical protein CFOL_v3_18214 [Cephalotus follicularis]
MKDQTQMLNQMNTVQPQIMNQNPVQMLVQSQPPPQVVNPVQPMMNQHPVQPMMMNRTYKPWQQQHQLPPSNFANSNPQMNLKPNNNRSNWKGKKVNNADKRKLDPRRIEKQPIPNPNLNNPPPSGTLGYNPPTLNELQSQNRLKARKFYPKKKHSGGGGPGGGYNNRFAPYAPRNTTSFIIRAKKAGGIASLVSPCPVTPAVLPTPIFSPSREVLGDMAKEEWGVDGYGSMKGLIRLRSPGHEVVEGHDEDEDEEGNGSSESDVEEHVEVERRLDHDLSRFEMIYPSYGGGGGDYNNVLENRVDDQDSHIAQLEEENLTLKERLFLMESELSDLRRRLQFLERRSQVVEDVNEEVVQNESENDSEGGSDIRGGGGGATGSNNNQEVMVENVSGSGNERNVEVDGNVAKEEVNHDGNEGVVDVCMEEFVTDDVAPRNDEVKYGEAMNVGNEIVFGKEDLKGEEAGNEIVADKIDAEANGEVDMNEFVREEITNEQYQMVLENEDSCGKGLFIQTSIGGRD